MKSNDNWTEEDLAQALKANPHLKINTRISQLPPAPAADTDAEEEKPAKYRNIKTEVDGIIFDSEKEAGRYQELKLMRLAGEIVDFELQPEFLLLEGFKKNGVRFRPIHYRADFKVFYPDGHFEIEDTKGKKTKEFVLKWKLFENRYPELSLKII